MWRIAHLKLNNAQGNPADGAMANVRGVGSRGWRV